MNVAAELVEFIKEFLVPGSVWFLMIAASACVAALYGSARASRAGRVTLLGLVVLYWFMSLPAVAHGLQLMQRGRGTETVTQLPDAPLPIVLLGNGLGGFAALGGRIETPLGQTALNTLFALDRYRQYPASTIIASGGAEPGIHDARPEAHVMREALLRNGVPADRIVVEDTSTTTHEQAVATGKILRARGERQCIVVTSPQQMGRAIDLFDREGIAVVPLRAGSLLWTLGETTRWWHWLMPSSVARAISRDVVYEWMAWPYYRMRGWIN